MQPYAIAAGYSSWGRWQSWGEWYQRRCRLSEMRILRDLDGEVLAPIVARVKRDKTGACVDYRELRPRVPYQTAVYCGYALFDTETEAYMHWQSEHAALSDCSGITPKGHRRRWKPGSFVNRPKAILYFIDQQELF